MSFELLHSFAIWAISDPSLLMVETTQFKPISIITVQKYLAAVRAWHIAQGWLAPLSDDHHNHINWSLCGLENIQGSRKKPICPPITVPMLQSIKAMLDINEPFDACIWAICVCTYWGMMQLGEVMVNSRNMFDKKMHLMWKDAIFRYDSVGNCYACLDLLAAKTAKPGEIQSVFLISQEGLCPLRALENLASVVPATADDPLFSW